MSNNKQSLISVYAGSITKWGFVKIIFLGIASGLMSFLFLALLNFIIAQLISGQYTRFNPNYAALFVFIIVLFIWSRRSLAAAMIDLSQEIFWRIRGSILKVVLKATYEQLTTQRNQIQTALITDVNILTQASLNIVNFLTAAVIVIACLIYMGVESITLFLATLIFSALGIIAYTIAARKNNAQFEKARDLENDFINYFDAIIDGFKEIQLEPKKGNDIFHGKIVPIAQNSYRSNTGAFIGFLNNQMTGQVLFYLLIAMVLVYFSVTLDIEAGTIVNFMFILLYVLGSIESIMVLLPGIMQATVSGGRIMQLRTDLLAGDLSNSEASERQKLENFHDLEVKDLIYQYKNDQVESPFTMGPISLSIKRGDVLFIYGGNGSGKTTFIHTLLGLLHFHDGAIKYNDQTVEADNYGNYKSLFGVVFNDFYLFDSFYGNLDFDTQKANEYLELFEMTDKIEMTDTGFSTTNLSTGQRKRLALIAVLLEQKPIIILDEWAADQDPVFRRKFYESIIPQLKQEGFTIVAITHDDNYYHHADRLFKMEYGRLIDEAILEVQAN